jgi:geranylgeranyl diphosphate synthase type I
MTSFFQHQQEIQAEIIAILEQYKKSSSSFALDELEFDHLLLVATKGKQFRGCLLVSLYESLGGKDLSQAIKLAAAVELYGTALLIHDDIMDRSETRRGFPSTYKTFESLATKNNLSDPSQFGVSVGISLGDVLFFLAESTIYSLELPAEKIVTIIKLCSMELLLLGLAQIEDIRLSFSAESVSQEMILKMYAGKTGRYTGRWPMQLAATLAGLTDEMSEKLGEIGEKIGVLFQIKDDELGVFGDEKVMGKSASSDITEGKKTLYYLLLNDLPDEAKKQKLFSILGKTDATAEEIEFVKQAMIESGVRASVERVMTQQKNQILQSIAGLSIPSQSKELLQQVVVIVSERSK